MIGLAEAAQREQRREAAPMLAAILQQSAHGLALDGAEAPALRTLDDAHAYAVTDESADATAGHGSFCTPAYLEMQRGVCWSTLGRHDRAVPAFETALAQLPDTYRRDRGVAHAGLAAAQLAENQIEPAAAAAREALAIAAGSGSARITDMVIKVTARLEPHRNLPEVAELLAELNVETTS
jgi:tetratricopeptide (TPR) repeat protein